MSRDITKCHPRLQKLAVQLITECAKAGLKIQITDCIRDYTEQADCVRRGTSGVSWPNSHHNWGTAFDFCRSDGKGAYNDSDGLFSKVGAIGRRIGLEWGGDWTKPKDKPHFQLPDWGSTTTKLKAMYGTPESFKRTWETEEEEMKRYNTIDEVPEWGKATIQELINNGCFADVKNLNLSEDMVRVFVILERSSTN